MKLKIEFKVILGVSEHHLLIRILPLIIHSVFVQQRLNAENCAPMRFPSAPSQNIREYQGILHTGINAQNHLSRFRFLSQPSLS